MGVYDTLIDGERSCQVKMFECELKSYKVGDTLTYVRDHMDDKSFVIVFPGYGEAKYGMVKDSVFLGLSDNIPKGLVTSPQFSKWGHPLGQDDNIDEMSPFAEAIRILRGEKNE